MSRWYEVHGVTGLRALLRQSKCGQAVGSRRCQSDASLKVMLRVSTLGQIMTPAADTSVGQQCARVDLKGEKIAVGISLAVQLQWFCNDG